MTIGSAVQKGNWVHIYDEKGSEIGNVYANDGVLIGYTATSVSVKKGSWVNIYDERGMQTGSNYV